MTKASNYFEDIVDGRAVAKSSLTPSDVAAYIDSSVDLLSTPIYAYQSVPVVVNNATTTKYIQTMRSETIAGAQKLNPSMALDTNNVAFVWDSNWPNGGFGGRIPDINNDNYLVYSAPTAVLNPNILSGGFNEDLVSATITDILQIPTGPCTPFSTAWSESIDTLGKFDTTTGIYFPGKAGVVSGVFNLSFQFMFGGGMFGAMVAKVDASGNYLRTVVGYPVPLGVPQMGDTINSTVAFSTYLSDSEGIRFGYDGMGALVGSMAQGKARLYTGFMANQLARNSNSATPGMMLVDFDGYAWTWGGQFAGQLGMGTTATDFQSYPVSVVGGRQFVHISAMPNTEGFIALDMSGKAWSWGANTNGNLGDGTTTDRSSPVSVLTAVSFVAAEGTCAIDTNNNCWAWGANASGQIGDGTTTSRSTPTQITGDFDGVVATVACGNAFKLVLTVDGYCYSFGDNTYGNLGIGTTANKSLPVSVLAGRKFVKVAAGKNHALALDAEGVVWAWGRNNSGQLGNGTTTDCSIPVVIRSPKKFVDIGADKDDSAALDTDGNIWIWGYVGYNPYWHTNTNPYCPYPNYKFKL